MIDQPSGSQPEQTRLESWKEIAEYLQRNTTTARRWEREEGLPVHRHSHKSRSSVYAYTSELDAWRTSRKLVPEPAPARPLWKIPAFALTLALCLVMVGNGVRPASAQTKQAMRQVWVGAGTEVDTHGAVSSDGRFLTFVDQTTGDLAIRNLETGENRRLTETGNTGNWNTFAVESSISTDGRQVAYTWYNGNDEGSFALRIVPAAGTKAAARVIYANKDVRYPQAFGWLPDGSGVLAYLLRSDQTHQIALIRSDGSGVKILKSFDWRSSNRLSVSPDGRYIAYDFPPTDDQHDIYILATDGNGEVRAVQHPADDLMVGWAPDGKTLLFASDRTGSLDLWSISVTDGKPSGQPALLKKDIGRILPLGLTARGTLYYGVKSGIRDVYTVSIDPRTLKPVSEPVLAAQRFLGTNLGPDWSADGKYLAYVSTREPASPNAITIHTFADGTERDVIPKLAYLSGYPPVRWSPDGRSIFVHGTDRIGQNNIYKVDAQTGETAAVSSEMVSPPVWSPDGHTMYYYRRAAETVTIMVLDARNNAERNLYSTRSYFGTLAISPDGKNLAFIDSDGKAKAQQLMVLPTDGGKPIVVVEAPLITGFSVLQWTPDGEFLQFAKPGPDKPRELWRVNLMTREQSLVAGGVPAGRISPDARHVAYVSGVNTSEVWALENFLPKAKGK